MNTKRSAVGLVLVSIAIGSSLLGTFGTFAVGFGIMTDCTNNYSCSSTGCVPCARRAAGSLGGIAQWVLAATGVVFLIRAQRLKRRAGLATRGVALLAVAVLTFVGTTWRAQESYCRPGTSEYDRSYCSVEA